MLKAALARIFGNAGMFFVTPYVGSGVAASTGISESHISLQTAGFIAIIGVILSASRELIEYGKNK